MLRLQIQVLIFIPVQRQNHYDETKKKNRQLEATQVFICKLIIG